MECVFLLENSSKGISNISLLMNKLGISATYTFAESLQNMAMHAESGAGVSVLPQSFVHTYQSPLLSYYPLRMEEAKLCMVAIWKKGSVCMARDLFLYKNSFLYRILVKNAAKPGAGQREPLTLKTNRNRLDYQNEFLVFANLRYHTHETIF